MRFRASVSQWFIIFFGDGNSVLLPTPRRLCISYRALNPSSFWAGFGPAPVERV